MNTTAMHDALPVVRLKNAWRSTHPWIFQKLVEKPAAKPRPGSLVDIVGLDGERIGRGFYNGHSRIALRILETDPAIAVDAAWFERKIAAAVALRREVLRLDEARAHVVELGVAARDVEHGFIDVDAGHFSGAAHRGVHAETAGVAAQVEHALALDVARQPLAVLALVGEETGLVRAGRVGAEADAVFGDDRRRRRLGTTEVERLLLLHVLVGEGVEAAARELLLQRVVDPFAMTEHAGAEELDHQQVGVTVDHQPGEAIAFRMHDAPGVGAVVELQQVAAQRRGRGDLAVEPGLVDGDIAVGFQDPQRDPRMAVVEAAADPLAIHADDLDDAAGFRLLRGLLHDLLEHPWMGGAPGIAEADGGVLLVHAPIIAASAASTLVFG